MVLPDTDLLPATSTNPIFLPKRLQFCPISTKINPRMFPVKRRVYERRFMGKKQIPL
jgi:hypothetical protein